MTRSFIVLKSGEVFERVSEVVDSCVGCAFAAVTNRHGYALDCPLRMPHCTASQTRMGALFLPHNEVARALAVAHKLAPLEYDSLEVEKRYEE